MPTMAKTDRQDSYAQRLRSAPIKPVFEPELAEALMWLKYGTGKLAVKVPRLRLSEPDWLMALSSPPGARLGDRPEGYVRYVLSCKTPLSGLR